MKRERGGEEEKERGKKRLSETGGRKGGVRQKGGTKWIRKDVGKNSKEGIDVGEVGEGERKGRRETVRK